VGTEEIGEMMYYSAVISLSDSDPGLPDLLQATFPARRLQYEAKNRSHRAWHIWEAVGQSAQEPLIRLLPYLRMRRRQAELALSLITLMQSDKAGSARPLSEEQQQARRLLYEQVRSLNARYDRCTGSCRDPASWPGRTMSRDAPVAAGCSTDTSRFLMLR
jgi:hypothetical protein